MVLILDRLYDLLAYSGNPGRVGRRPRTAREHLRVGDMAQAGGWESTETLQRCYQQPDAETILAVVLGGAELREVQA